jgi:hypothetical protein
VVATLTQLNIPDDNHLYSHVQPWWLSLSFSLRGKAAFLSHSTIPFTTPLLPSDSSPPGQIYLHHSTAPTKIADRASHHIPIKTRKPLNGFSRNLILGNISRNCLASPIFVTIVTSKRSFLGRRAVSSSDSTSRRFESYSYFHLLVQATMNVTSGSHLLDDTPNTPTWLMSHKR